MGADSSNTVTILISDKRRETVRVTEHIGQFAIHPRFRYGEAEGPGWTVTHVPTGKSVYHVAQQEDARRVAKWLVRVDIIPADPVKYDAWTRQFTDAQAEEIRTAMRDIAEPAL